MENDYKSELKSNFDLAEKELRGLLNEAEEVAKLIIASKIRREDNAYEK